VLGLQNAASGTAEGLRDGARCCSWSRKSRLYASVRAAAFMPIQKQPEHAPLEQQCKTSKLVEMENCFIN
jgi:hypothetical protein